MKKLNGVKHSMQSKVQSRRKGVIERLTAHLKTGIKCKGQYDSETYELTDHDRNRISKEIETLKIRI